jgi:hypothetical protein
MDRFWLDLGLIINMDKEREEEEEEEEEEEGKGCTWLWRRCCLDKVKTAFEIPKEKGSGVEAYRYNWCFTRDAGDMTLAGRAKSVIRRGGLMYSQFYGMIKEQFDAAKHYPWDENDDTMVMMALDEDYKEALRSVVGSEQVDMEVCRESYNHCGRRVVLGLRMNDGRSWGVREEHRMSLNLAMAVNAELRSRGEPRIREGGTVDGFYVHWTRNINLFTEIIVLTLARWYQEILGTSNEGDLGVDRQKLAVMVSLLLKNSYGSGLLGRHPTLWEKRNKDEKKEGGQKSLGLGLKHIIEEYGFGWLPEELFDWKSNNFAMGIAEHFPFPIRALQRRYESRRKSQGTMMKMMQDMDLVTGRLRCMNKEDCLEEGEGRWRFWIHWLAIRIMRQYHEDVWQRLYQSPFEFPGKERQRRLEEKASRMKESDGEMEEGELSNDEAAIVEPRKRRKARKEGPRKKRSKGVAKDFKDPPLLIYKEVCKELGERPVATGKGKTWTTRRLLFQLLFYPEGQDLDISDSTAQGWQNLPYLHGFRRARRELKEKAVFKRELDRELWTSFERYCHCIPSVSRDRWISSDSSKKKPAWIGFDLKGNRSDRLDRSGGSSWEFDNRIDQDWCWDLSGERAVMEEMVEEARWRRGREGAIYERSSREKFGDRIVEVFAID